MNYVETLNQFWRLRRGRRITNIQADLYFWLLNESSSRGSGSNWENPLQCPNGLVCSAIGISEKTLIDARNVLQQLGLIQFENGITKQKAPIYYLPDYWNKVSNPVSIPGSIPGGNPVSIPGGNNRNIKGNKRNKTERNETVAGASPPASEKKVRLYWKEFVQGYVDFYKKSFKTEEGQAKKPKLTGTDMKHLGAIYDGLRDLSAQQNQDWTMERALNYQARFLQKAFEDKFLNAHFELKNMSGNFNSLTAKKENESTVKPATGQQTVTSKGTGTY